MKKLLILATITSIVMFAGVVEAAVVFGGEEYSLRQDETVSQNMYVGAGSAAITGEINGDLVIGGGEIIVNGDVEKDILTVGGSVNISGNTGDDIRAIGGSVIIGGNVGGDVVVAGGAVRVLSNVVISGDLIVAGGQILIDGSIEGDTRIVGGDVIVNGKINGNAVIKASDSFNVGDSAVIKGNVHYSGRKTAIVSEHASIEGDFIFDKIHTANGFRKFPAAAVGVALLFKVALLIVAGVLAVVLFKKFSAEIVNMSLSRPGKSALVGFVVLVVVPVAIILAFVTILGFMVGIFGALVYALLAVISKIFAGIIAGGVLASMAKDEAVIDWKWAVGGIILLQIIGLIPLIGWIAYLAFFVIAFGAISEILYDKIWIHRK